MSTSLAGVRRKKPPAPRPAAFRSALSLSDAVHGSAPSASSAAADRGPDPMGGPGDNRGPPRQVPSFTRAQFAQPRKRLYHLELLSHNCLLNDDLGLIPPASPVPRRPAPRRPACPCTAPRRRPRHRSGGAGEQGPGEARRRAGMPGAWRRGAGAAQAWAWRWAGNARQHVGGVPNAITRPVPLTSTAGRPRPDRPSSASCSTWAASMSAPATAGETALGDDRDRHRETCTGACRM